jgi:hypothetical protein
MTRVRRPSVASARPTIRFTGDTAGAVATSSRRLRTLPSKAMNPAVPRFHTTTITLASRLWESVFAVAVIAASTTLAVNATERGAPSLTIGCGRVSPQTV